MHQLSSSISSRQPAATRSWLRPARTALMMAALSLALTLLSGSTLRAATMSLGFSGILAPTSTINGTPLIDNTPFSYTAIFDSSADISGANGGGVYAAVLNIQIEGYGSFRSLAGSDLYVLLLDPDFGLYPGYAVGVVDLSIAHGHYGVYSTASPPFDADAPAPTVLTGQFTGGSNYGLIVPLEGGGELSLDVLDVGAAATLSPVPEPGTLSTAFTGGGLLATAILLRRRKQAVRQ